MSSTSEDEESESHCSGPSTSKKLRLSRDKSLFKKQKHRIQKYRVEWERDIQCSPWLGRDINDNTKARCKWCNVSLIADISLIKTHGLTAKHGKHGKDYECSSSNLMNKYFQPQTTLNTLDKNIKNVEIKICGFMAAHNIPYSIVDDLIPCLKSALPDSKILQEVYMKRLKATKIVTNVIGASHKDTISNHLKKQKFSILTDDSTDCSHVKTACIVVRYYDEECGQITSKFWDLTSVFPKDDVKAAEEGATGQHLYNLLMTAFTRNNIPLNNVIGFGCDGASVNVGEHNSITSRLKETCPGLIIMKCICHSLHLAASDACKEHMPRSCEDLARNVHNYVRNSAKRIASLAVFQKFLNVAVHKILHPAQTRWLSLLSVVDRMLEQWEPLRLYFIEQHLKDRTLAAESISIWLRDPFVKLFYYFLSWVLPKVLTMNAFFQSENVVVTSLAQKMAFTFKELLIAYMEQEYVARTPLSKIDTGNERMFIPLKNIYLGVKALEKLKEQEILTRPDLINEFYIRCRKFMIKLCNGIQNRFNFDDPLLIMLPLLHPSKALSKQERNTTQSLEKLWNHIPRAKPKDLRSLQLLDDEWRRLPLDNIPTEIIEEQQVDIFWHKVSQLKDSENCDKYIELPRFALAVLCVPHANASCERVFSKYNLVKTKTRNRLTIENVEGAMLASQCVKSNKSCCAGFEPAQDMYCRMTSKILYGNKKENEYSKLEDSNNNIENEDNNNIEEDKEKNEDLFLENHGLDFVFQE